MKATTYQKFASAAAFVVALSSLSYGLIFLLLVPAAQKQLAKTPASLTSFAANPTCRQIASLLLALGGLAATAAIAAHGLRNEITTSHESASPVVLFTPLIW